MRLRATRLNTISGVYKKSFWTPAQLPGLALWLDAADASTITLNGSNVSQWNDKSGAARHFAQATAANQPAYNTTAINNKPGIVFDGVNDNLGAQSAVIQPTHSLFVVFVPTVLAATAKTLIGQWASGQTGRFLINLNQNCSGTATAGRLNMFNSSTTQGACAGGFTADVAIANETTLIESICTTGAENWKLLKNGLEWESATITSVFQGVNTAFGTSSAGLAGSCDATMAEVVITSSVLSTADRQLVEGYLAWKWGGI